MGKEILTNFCFLFVLSAVSGVFLLSTLLLLKKLFYKEKHGIDSVWNDPSVPGKSLFPPFDASDNKAYLLKAYAQVCNPYMFLKH